MTEQNRTEQNRTEQNRTEQNRTEQNRTEQNRTEQNNLVGYVINLNRHPDRLKKFFLQPQASFFTRMPAVDKKLIELFDLDNFFDIERCKTKMGRPVTSGEIGCTLSHIACWKAIANNNALSDRDFAVVAEDDVVLKAEFQEEVQNVIHTFESGKWINQENVDFIILQNLNFNWFDCDENGFTPMYFVYDNGGSALYLIRKSLAIELTERMKKEKPFWLADWFESFCNRERIRGVKPSLGQIEGGYDAPSDLEADRILAREQH